MTRVDPVGMGGRREPASRLAVEVGDKIGTTTVVGVRQVHNRRRVIDVERRDGAYRRFWTSLWPTEIGDPALAAEFALPLEIVHPCWLIAAGGSERVEVLRSPLVRDDDSWLEPVHGYIKDHGLVLAAQETFEDEGWMFGKVEMSVYTKAAA